MLAPLMSRKPSSVIQSYVSLADCFRVSTIERLAELALLEFVPEVPQSRIHFEISSLHHLHNTRKDPTKTGGMLEDECRRRGRGDRPRGRQPRLRRNETTASLSCQQSIATTCTDILPPTRAEVVANARDAHVAVTAGRSARARTRRRRSRHSDLSRSGCIAREKERWARDVFGLTTRCIEFGNLPCFLNSSTSGAAISVCTRPVRCSSRERCSALTPCRFVAST
jgi:hypothetical protein